MPIYYFSAPKGKYPELATSSHHIDAEGYDIRPDFISLVRELNFHARNPPGFQGSGCP
jgi:hypothetical protein